MDIDSPPLDAPTAHQLTLPTFSSAFPLPFRVLALVGFALLLWAVNMHVLTLLGVDVAWAADLGGPDAPPKEEEDDDDDDGDDGQVVFDAFDTDLPAGAAGKLIDPPVRPSFDGYGRMIGNDPATPTGSRAVFTFPTPSVSEGANFNNNYNEDEDDDRPTAQSVYRGVYALFLVYTLYVGCAWLAFRLVTTPSPSEIASTVLRLSSDDHDGSTRAAAAGQAEREKMERYRALVGVFVIGLVGMGLGTGFGWGRWKVGERERRSFLRSFRRILLPPTTHAPFFADVILADILTSFAKVLGDVVVSACQVWSGGITKGRVRVGGVGDWVVLGMVSLPYLLRLRQCIHEYLLPRNTSSRPLLNAIKYASAFPVIFLSAAQRTVVSQVAQQHGVSVEQLPLVTGGSRWFGEHRLFRLWLLAVIINSTYSFWWDVTNDWGLTLLQPETWSPAPGDLPTTSTMAGGGRIRGGAGSGNNIPTVAGGIGHALLVRVQRALMTWRAGGISLSSPTTATSASAAAAAGEYEMSSAGDEHHRSPMPSPQIQQQQQQHHYHLRRRSSFTVPLSPDPTGAGASKGTHSRSHSHSSHFHPATGISDAITNNNGASSSTRRPSSLRSWFSALPFRNMPNPLFFGLRTRLLFPDPLVYHVFIAIDFSLRFTWSLKLSSHLHTIAEIESGVFMMEALELLRRWMWVFLRTEWEVVKKMEEAELLRGGGGRRGRRQGRAEEERYWRQQQHHQAKIATARARAVDNMGEKQAGPGPF